MTTNRNHPINPPPDVIHNWLQLEKTNVGLRDILTLAAQWGADQELEACVSFLAAQGWDFVPGDLYAARRPKLPSLKEQAQRILVENGMTTDGRLELDGADLQVIQAALLRLPD